MTDPDDINDISCSLIQSVNASERCDFYNRTIDCHDSDGKLDYMYFIFCIFQEQNAPAIVLCVVWLLMLFVALGVTADDFLCPSLVVITKTLHLSQNIAGVTFLAFGNGAPDIFSSVAGIEQARPELVIGTLFGAGIFVTSVVAGSIIVARPFKIMERPFLRDILFYICASFWAFLRFYYREVSIGHSVGFVALYILYICVVIISRLIYNRYRTKTKAAAEEDGKAMPIPTISVQLPEESERRTSSSVTFNTDPEEDNPEAQGVVLRRFSFRGSISGGYRHRRSSCHAHHEHVLKALTQSVNHKPDPSYKNGTIRPPPLDTQLSKHSMSSLLSTASWDKQGHLKEFFLHVCPLDIEGWHERRWFAKILDVVKSPICFLLIITVPVVDYENDKNNWCRYLHFLHCFTAPLFVMATVGELHSSIQGVFPCWGVVLVASAFLGLIVLVTSTNDEPPVYHWLFGYVGFATSVMWVYLIASEIVSLLKAIGIVFHLSDAILGLTVLAWGNSIGDFISNLSVAKQGYPRMGISACYGGPLLNLLMGIGIPYTVMIVKQGHPLKLQFTRLITLLYSTLTIILVSSIITMTALRFNANRYFGFFLLTCYAIFLVVAILFESKVIG